MSSKNIKVLYSISLLGGYILDLLSKLTGMSFPLVLTYLKFCADTTIGSIGSIFSGF
tara:strand:- start:2922 stop:3092 length:171 start_codon:yes stop_codon:yes gene_type:complete